MFQDGSGLVRYQNIISCLEDSEINSTDFNLRLTSMIQGAFVDVLHKVFTDEDFIENEILFKHENVWTNTLSLSNSFVGYEIDNCKMNDITSIINALILEFDSSETITIYLFNSQRNTAIQSKA